MDAPIYPPSVAYHGPARLPEVMSSKTTTITDLLANPAAKAIVIREIPGFESRIANPMLKPHLGAFSLRSLVQFGMFKSVSFSDGIRTQQGDEFAVEADAFRLPVRNPLAYGIDEGLAQVQSL